MKPLPSVEPLPPGTRPTEPGWYVVKNKNDRDLERAPRIRHVVSGPDNQLVYEHGTKFLRIPKTTDTFIARIYPDRIGQE